MSTAIQPTTPGRVLIVEDDASLRRFVAHAAQRDGYVVESVGTGQEALRTLEQQLFDVVLLDVRLPDLSGLDVLARGRAHQTDARFVVMTGAGSAELAVQAMKLGAFDFVLKPVGVDELLRTMNRALEEIRQGRGGTGTASAEWSERWMVGSSPAMQRVRELVKRVAPTRATVLITGEPGTGKELVARGIHEASDRAHAPFVSVNCSALPEGLLESALFGYATSAAGSGAGEGLGLLERAHGGTLLLDEVAASAPAVQVRLLRLLQDRALQRPGDGQPSPLDVRIIATGGPDLEREVAAGRFREDLYSRLNVFPIALPPLRERRSDIPELANHFRLRFALEHGVEPPEIGEDTMRRLVEYDWPGNVRELETFFERSVILHAGASTLPFEPPCQGRRDAERDLLGRAVEEKWSLDQLEREYILAMMRETHGHQIRASGILGIDRRTLHRKLKQYRREDSTTGARWLEIA